MYVGRVNWLVIEYRVVENASTGDDICGQEVGIIGGADGARGPWVKVATTHLTEKMPSNPKK